MIAYPLNWDYIYSTPTLEKIEATLFSAVAKTKCKYLCLSGGIDSSLTLYFLTQIYPDVTCFTIASSREHPDLHYSKIVAEQFKAAHLIYIPTQKEISGAELDGDLQGDVAVRLLYRFISQFTDEVITTDCIDELDCGYYPHQAQPNDETFRQFIYDLEEKHLKPLNRNSGQVRALLPYATEEVVNMFLRIPISQKVNNGVRKSHIVEIAGKYLPEEIIMRRKYGFCSALEPIKE